MYIEQEIHKKKAGKNPLRNQKKHGVTTKKMLEPEK